MGRTRRKASSEKEYEDNASSCSTPPAKDKENCFPSSIRERPSSDDDQQQRQIIALRKDYDQNGKQKELCVQPQSVQHTFMLFISCPTVAMTIKDMLANKQVMIEKLTVRFYTASLMKMPEKIKKMKWADYLVRIYLDIKFIIGLLNNIYLIENEGKCQSRNSQCFATK